MISVRYLSPAGPLYIGEPDLKEWGIAPEKLSLQSFSGARWLCVEGLGLNYRLDPAKLTLALDFPPELFGGSRESFVLEDRVPVTYAPGGFLNYDLRFDRTEGVKSLGANWEIGAFARPGLFTSSFFSGDGGRGTIRLDTAFRRDDPERITSFVAGDTITRAGSYGASVRIGGLQYQRNFATAPLLITYPEAAVSGTAVVPSTVDIYIGNARAYSTQVRPGPFSLSNLPVPVGAGNVRVVVRDVFGKETTAVVPYVRYDSMLKKGLHDFSYEAGFLRNDYAVESNAYGTWAAVATHRYGVTDWLTLEGHAEGMADRGNLGGVVQVTMPVLGLVGIGGAASGGLGNGKLGKAFFQRNEPNWTIGAAVQQQSEDYVDIAFEPGQIRTLSVRQASASARVTDRIWLNVLGLKTRDQTGDFNTVTFGWSVSLTRSATLTANISRFSGSTQPTSTVFSMTLALPLSRARLRHRHRRAPQRRAENGRAAQREPQSAGDRQLRLSHPRRRAVRFPAPGARGVLADGRRAVRDRGGGRLRHPRRPGPSPAAASRGGRRMADFALPRPELCHRESGRLSGRTDHRQRPACRKNRRQRRRRHPAHLRVSHQRDRVRGRGHSTGGLLRGECEAGEDRKPHGRAGGHGCRYAGSRPRSR